jgi:hypothetical protein
MGFGLVIGFIEHLQIVTIALSLIHILCSSVQHILSSVCCVFTSCCLATDSALSSAAALMWFKGWCLSHNSLFVPTVLLTTSQHRPHRKHRSSVAVQLLLSALRRKHHSSAVICGPLPRNGHCPVTHLVGVT